MTLSGQLPSLFMPREAAVNCQGMADISFGDQPTSACLRHLHRQMDGVPPTTPLNRVSETDSITWASTITCRTTCQGADCRPVLRRYSTSESLETPTDN